MRVDAPQSKPRVLASPVAVVLRSKAECVGDRQLEEFQAGEGPAAGEVAIILENLLSGEALPQTVALLKDDSSGKLLGIASVRSDGNEQIRSKASTPWFLRRLAVNPYVNLVARDARYRNHLLCDGQTRLGVALVRAALEVVALQHDGDGAMPTVWALIRRRNEVSKRVFREFAFYPHARSHENQQDVFVRRAGRGLPPAPARDAYVPPSATGTRLTSR